MPWLFTPLSVSERGRGRGSSAARKDVMFGLSTGLAGHKHRGGWKISIPLDATRQRRILLASELETRHGVAEGTCVAAAGGEGTDELQTA